MHTRIVTTVLGLIAILILSGCATNATEGQHYEANPPMISAAEFEVMINVEVTVLEPAADGDTALAALN